MINQAQGVLVDVADAVGWGCGSVQVEDGWLLWR